jgi:hypothetical protein
MRLFSSQQTRRRAGRFVPRLEGLEERTLLSIAFAPPIDTAAGMNPFAVAVADFNHDGLLDVAVANANNGGLSLLLGNDQGGFTPAPGSPLLPKTSLTDVVAGDFNGDGYADLAATNPYTAEVTVLLNDQKGGFTTAPGSPMNMAGTYPLSLAVGDFNGDGKPDLLVAQYDGNAVMLLRGQGDGSFALSTLQSGNFGHCKFLAVGDFNNDGKLDYAVTESGNEVSMFGGDGNGGFDAETDVGLSNPPDGVAVGDFNHDGNLDVALVIPSDNTVRVLQGDGNGHFPHTYHFAAGTTPVHVAVGDFNGDHRLDLAVTSQDGVTVLQGDGNFGFTPVAGSPFPVGANPFGVTVGDFNNDGTLDVVTANHNSSNISVLLNETGDRTTLSASANPVGVNQPVTFTATVSPTVPGSGVPTGAVVFRDGGTVLALVPLDSAGHASLTLPTLSLGSHSITAAYFGGGIFLPTDSDVLSETVSPVGDVTSLLRVTPGKVVHHKWQKVTLKNTGSQALVGPFQLVLDNLSRGVKLLKSSGRTHTLAPLHSPYLLVNTLVLDPGQSVLLTLQFANPGGRGIHYTPRVVSGTGAI